MSQIIPPFDESAALAKVRLAEDSWNSGDAARVAMAYSESSRWRNRTEFVCGRPAIVALLTRKWSSELDYRLTKDLWTFGGNRIAVRFAYEFRDVTGQWFRAYGNENWEFDDDGLMRLRVASINDHPITDEARRFRWPLGSRPAGHPGFDTFGF